MGFIKGLAKQKFRRNANFENLFMTQRISLSLFSWQRGCQEKLGFCFMTMTFASQNGACANQCNHLTNVRYNDLVSQRRHDKRLNIFKCFVLFL
jgi:hypothetical protein